MSSRGSIPSFTKSGNTDQRLPPTVTSLVPHRRPPHATFIWTAKLSWPQVGDGEEQTPISDVDLPEPFKRDRGDILAALAGTAGAYSRSITPNLEVEVDIDARVGIDRQPVTKHAPAVLHKLTITAAEGSCSIVALVRVEVALEDSPKILGILDSDVDVRIHMQDTLPLERKAAKKESAEASA